jgi:hypothetical protein
MKFGKLLFLLIVFMFPVYIASAQVDEQEPEYENLTSPVDLVASYYNAINRHEYLRAYGYWETAPNPYNEFVQGFADTISVQVIIQPPTRIGAAAGSRYVEIPTVLIADHQAGTQHSFAGCFVTRISNLRPPAIPEEDVWHLYNADIAEVSDETATIPALLTEACEPS